MSTTTRLRAAGATVSRKKARGGETAVGRTTAAATIKGGCEAEALEQEVEDAGIDDDDFARGRCCHPTTPTTIAEAADVDDAEATSGGAPPSPAIRRGVERRTPPSHDHR
jgi:hypothetical protein